MTVSRVNKGSKPCRRMPSTPASSLLLTVALLAACGQDEDTGSSGSAGDISSPAVTDSSTAPLTTTTATAADLDEILVRALTHEHETKATYDNVVATLGNVAPFSAVAPAEAQHIAELESAARAHGIDIEGITATASPAPATLAEACQAGVAWEEATVALYDELLPQVAAYSDVEYVFTNLRSASRDNHLPAFERCG